MNPDPPTLRELNYLPYIDDTGHLPPGFEGRIGVYAIFDGGRALRFVGYSRDVHLSLLNHLIRQPEACQWLKIHPVERPSRTALEELRRRWIEENGETPPGNGEREGDWTGPIDVGKTMGEDDRTTYAALTESERVKFLKNLCRGREREILNALESRGLAVEIRFNPKLKESGLLDLKS